MTGNTFYFLWEVDLMTWIQSFPDKLVILAASFFTLFGEEMVLVSIVGILYWSVNKETAKRLGTNLMISLLIGSALKNVFLRRRPYFDNAEIRCLRPVEAKADIYDIAAQGYSMPSLHSTNALVLFGTLAQAVRKSWFTAVGILLTLLVGLSRVAFGVHFPTDVLAGWAVGLIALSIGTLLVKKKASYLTTGIVLLAIFLPCWFFCKTSDFYSSYGLTAGLLFGFYFEEKKVNFENTKKILFCAIRFVGGLLVFVALSELLKLPFPESVVNGNDFAAHFVRSMRYAAASFVAMGIYPMLFKRIEESRIFAKYNMRASKNAENNCGEEEKPEK